MITYIVSIRLINKFMQRKSNNKTLMKTDKKEGKDIGSKYIYILKEDIDALLSLFKRNKKTKTTQIRNNFNATK